MSTLNEIHEQIIAQFEAEFGKAIPLAPKSFIRVLAKVMAGAYIMLYKYGNWVALQMFTRTAHFGDTYILGEVVNPLVERGRQIGVTDPFPGSQARLMISISVNNQSGSLPIDTQLRGNKNGVIYLTLDQVALNADTVLVEVVAAVGYPGVIGNLEVGDLLTFVNPVANVARDCVVQSVLELGTDPETESNYRERVQDKEKKAPQGGAYSDYEQWSEAVPGVLNAYPYAGTPGVVDLYIESATGLNGIPTTALLTAVEDYIAENHNIVWAYVNVQPIIRSGFSVIVYDLLVENQSDVQQQIITAIGEFMYSREPYIVGLSIPPRKDRITGNAINSIVYDVVNAAGGTFTGTQITGPGGVTDFYILSEGEKAYSTGVTFS